MKVHLSLCHLLLRVDRVVQMRKVKSVRSARSSSSLNGRKSVSINSRHKIYCKEKKDKEIDITQGQTNRRITSRSLSSHALKTTGKLLVSIASSQYMRFNCFSLNFHFFTFVTAVVNLPAFAICEQPPNIADSAHNQLLPLKLLVIPEPLAQGNHSLSGGIYLCFNFFESDLVRLLFTSRSSIMPCWVVL